MIVIGDYINDIYIYGEAKRLSPEAPIPVFEEKYTEKRPGGVGNVIENLKALGSHNINTWYDSDNSVKKRYVYHNHIMFRVDDEIYKPEIDIVNKLNKFLDLNKANSIALLSDYNKGYLHLSADLINLLNRNNIKVIVDPKKHISNYRGAYLVKFNREEFEKYTDSSIDYLSIKDVSGRYDISNIIITNAGRKVTLYHNGEFYNFQPEYDQVSDVTGAGDIFIAVLAHYLDNDYSILRACHIACRLASLSVSKFGTYVINKDDKKKAEKRIVFTNGCFDILHKGHLDILKKSKDLGSKLIVGLNSDASVKRLKGKKRPYNNQDIRKKNLLELNCVDDVIIFEEDTPYELIKKVKPDLITKGGDYANTYMVVGNDLAEVIILPYLDGYSTTGILDTMNG